ncbi:MAG: damage-inducible protein DinB, partial [Chloroflexi bacterium]|nr:damage-inducible protein DinB [Chloroflexota bacterium]
HVFNHSTEHRSQVALYLAMNGIDLGNLDFTAYLRDKK